MDVFRNIWCCGTSGVALGEEERLQSVLGHSHSEANLSMDRKAPSLKSSLMIGLSRKQTLTQSRPTSSRL